MPISPACGRGYLLYLENHSPSEWFSRYKKKTPFGVFFNNQPKL